MVAVTIRKFRSSEVPSSFSTIVLQEESYKVPTVSVLPVVAIVNAPDCTNSILKKSVWPLASIRPGVELLTPTVVAVEQLFAGAVRPVTVQVPLDCQPLF
jgi:hypothetical protein